MGILENISQNTRTELVSKLKPFQESLEEAREDLRRDPSNNQLQAGLS